MPTVDQIGALTEALVREQQARQEAETALAEAQRARQQFVSLVTHELRVPMTSIKGYTDLLLKGIVGPLNEAQTNFLQTVRFNVERMARMVADLGDINKLEGQILTFTPAAVALNTALNEALRPLEKAIAQKSQTITRTISDDLPALWCDHDRLVQILGNLLSNAHLYTPEGGDVTITAEFVPDASAVRVALRDNGIGILPEEQHHVFEMFFRASDEETRQVPGNGLALHLSKRLIEQQDGQLWFESQRGVGSTFTFQLPSQS
ncbi:MAG: HAMP domain-containing histidine kinase [Anaerolineae bacterium]|nr:HAMP domain-containing histidine kinase [Anaerolineae bacterium]